METPVVSVRPVFITSAGVTELVRSRLICYFIT